MNRPLILALLLASLTGCAAMLKTDPATGQPVEPKQVDPDKVAAIQGAARTTGVAFGPLGVGVGEAIAALIGVGALVYAGKLKGEKAGYDQGALDAGKPLASAGEAPKP